MFKRLAEAGAQIVVNDLLPVAAGGLYPRKRRPLDWRQDDLGRVDHGSEARVSKTTSRTADFTT